MLWNHAVSRLVSRSDSAVATVDKMVKESVGYAVARTEWMVAKSSEVQVPFVIGADGHQSLVRRSLGIDFPAAGPAQHFAVFEFDSSADLGDEMRLMFGDRTTDVLWPLPDRHCRWSFELFDDDAPAATRTKNRIPVEIGDIVFRDSTKNVCAGWLPSPHRGSKEISSRSTGTSWCDLKNVWRRPSVATVCGWRATPAI